MRTTDALRLAVEESHRFLNGSFTPPMGQGLHRNLLDAVDQITKEHSMTEEDERPLDAEQSRRVSALRAARDLLSGRPNVVGVRHPVDVMDVHNLARYILTGEDPWALDPVREAGLETATDAISAPASPQPGSATAAFRTDPEIAVNAVLDALRIEVKRTEETGVVSLKEVLRAIEDARPLPDFD